MHVVAQRPCPRPRKEDGGFAGVQHLQVRRHWRAKIETIFDIHMENNKFQSQFRQYIGAARRCQSCAYRGAHKFCTASTCDPSQALPSGAVLAPFCSGAVMFNTTRELHYKLFTILTTLASTPEPAVFWNLSSQEKNYFFCITFASNSVY